MVNSPELPVFTTIERERPHLSLRIERPTIEFLRRGIEAASHWLGDRVVDAGHWLAYLLRYLPARVGRLLMTLGEGVLAALRFGPSAIKIALVDPPSTRRFAASCARRGSIRIVQIVLEVADLVGAPEIFAFIWRAITRTSPLTAVEVAAAASVLGQSAVRYQDVRIAQGGALKLVFALNGHRAFATFHTVNLPERGRHQRDNIDIVVHEIVHVFQYERAGSRYFAEALIGQRQEGYDYGGPEGLRMAESEGKRLRHFNREQQAQMAQDYFAAARNQVDLSAYEPFIRQLRQAEL